MKNSSFRRKFRVLALAAAFLTACAGAPVQEMSDARQAIQAARQAGAEQFSPHALAEAQELMQRAEKQLELGEYSEARESALSAKQKAGDARKEAMSHHDGG